MICDLVIPIRTRNRTNQRVHWGAKASETKAERQATALYLAQLRLPTHSRVTTIGGKPRMVSSLIDPPLPCVVTLTRLSERYLDDDGPPAALKAVRDEIACWLGIDDRDPRVTFRYGQQKVARGHFGVRVQIEACADAPAVS